MHKSRYSVRSFPQHYFSITSVRQKRAVQSGSNVTDLDLRWLAVSHPFGGRVDHIFGVDVEPGFLLTAILNKVCTLRVTCRDNGLTFGGATAVNFATFEGKGNSSSGQIALLVT